MEIVNVTLRRSIAVAALVLAPVLSSCGLHQPTDRVYNPGVGVNERSGQVDVLGAVVVSGKDGSGTLSAAVVNNNQQQGDALTQVAGSGQDADVTATVSSPIQIKPGSSVQLTDESTPIAVKGKSIKTGAFVTLTFSFQNAESVSLDVPVVANRGDYADVPLP
ncbi:MAG TPA: hypothetical protein VK204_15435 [Nocardioidaceae bacterium]|nr:hypothetical protein [Nocardioidaceae bacterium]